MHNFVLFFEFFECNVFYLSYSFFGKNPVFFLFLQEFFAVAVKAESVD